LRDAIRIAAAVQAGEVTAGQIVERCLAALDAHDNELAAVTHILCDRARQEAALVDAAIAAGESVGPLAGVPYGVKDLFDIAGLPTTAGSALYADAVPATKDAEAIRRLQKAGAILVATLNMDEFAYGFATINAHHGTARNPHDPDRLAGGSSGGSAAIVAAGLLSFSLGSDTNGSVRVPASLTGLFGLKPAHDSLPMDGVFPFAESFDDIGHFARSVADLRAIWEVLSGQSAVPAEHPLRVARLGGRFRENADPDQIAAMDAIAPDVPIIDLPDVAKARSAAFLITAFEGGAVHRDALTRNAMAFDPATRDRLLAGALLPRALYDEAQAYRTRFKLKIAQVLADYDIVLAPATPGVAPMVADPRVLIDGAMTPAGRDLGIHTQPISFTGLPALSVPLFRPGRLPLGLQLIGRAGGEATLFRFAAELEGRGLVGVSAPVGKYRGTNDD
jgi:aspartyl-tRNA(Asn)/glutamyl-tRNA(Gln) amidotransferase subunit A